MAAINRHAMHTQCLYCTYYAEGKKKIGEIKYHHLPANSSDAAQGFWGLITEFEMLPKLSLKPNA